MAAAQPAAAAGGQDAAFAAISAGNDEGPTLSAGTAAQGAHGRLQACGMHNWQSCTATRATAAAAAAPPLLLLLPAAAAAAGQLDLQSAAPTDTNTSLRPMTVGQSLV